MLAKQLFSLAIIFSFILPVQANKYFIAPNGNDAYSGNINSPFLTLQRAQEWVNPGDTVYIRGGIYPMEESQIAHNHAIWSYVTHHTKSGTAGATIKYWAYPDETPVFKYHTIKPQGKRVIAFMVSGSWIHIKGIEVTGVQVTVNRHTQSECFEIKGSNNLLEQINMHDGMAIGVYILRGSNNVILNCDAYQNWDSVSENGKGGNTDGFGCHVSKGDKGNIFKGCRAWFNSDDGFDCLNSDETVLFDHCWAFYNGFSSDFKSRADGNGFKAGGYGNGSFEHLPDTIPTHTVQFCLAVGNKQNGFYANHHLNGCNWYNNTACRNKRNYNMLNRESLSKDGYLKDIPGWGHQLYNNIGFSGASNELANIDTAKCKLANNSFDLNLSKADFISFDEKELIAPRQANGDLPLIRFLNLAAKSQLIDKGKNLGFDFYGTAPDLGCFEYRKQ